MTFEHWRIRARTYGRLVGQILGLTLVAWGAYEAFLWKPLARSAPELHTTTTEVSPALQFEPAVVILLVGCAATAYLS